MAPRYQFSSPGDTGLSGPVSEKFPSTPWTFAPGAAPTGLLLFSRARNSAVTSSGRKGKGTLKFLRQLGNRSAGNFSLQGAGTKGKGFPPTWGTPPMLEQWIILNQGQSLVMYDVSLKKTETLPSLLQPLIWIVKERSTQVLNESDMCIYWNVLLHMEEDLSEGF